MKKIIQLVAIIITVAILATFAGCTKPESTEATTKREVVTTEAEEAKPMTVADELIEACRNGSWDGSRRVVDGRAYFMDERKCILETSVEDYSGGGLFIGCPDLPDWDAVGNVMAIGGCPDLPDWDAVGNVVAIDDGVVAYDSDVTELVWARKGEIVSRFDLETYRDGLICRIQNSHMEFFSYGKHSVVIRQGEHLFVFHPAEENGDWEDFYLRNVTDVKVDGDQLLIADYYSSGTNSALSEEFRLKSTGTQYTVFPEDIKDKDSGFSGKGHLFYAGTGLDEKYYFLEDNGNGRSYTLYYRDVDSGKTTFLCTDVVDAESSGSNCVFVDTRGNVHIALLDKVVEEGVVKGKAICLTTSAGEGDPVYAVVKDGTPEATSIDGWKNVLAF